MQVGQVDMQVGQCYGYVRVDGTGSLQAAINSYEWQLPVGVPFEIRELYAVIYY